MAVVEIICLNVRQTYRMCCRMIVDVMLKLQKNVGIGRLIFIVGHSAMVCKKQLWKLR